MTAYQRMTSTGPKPQRGEYLRSAGPSFRVVYVTSTTLTTRTAHTRRWVEWLHARWEDFVWWVTD